MKDLYGIAWIWTRQTHHMAYLGRPEDTKWWNSSCSCCWSRTRQPWIPSQEFLYCRNTICLTFGRRFELLPREWTTSEKTRLTVFPAVRGKGFVQRQEFSLIPPLNPSLSGSDVTAGAATGVVPAGFSSTTRGGGWCVPRAGGGGVPGVSRASSAVPGPVADRTGQPEASSVVFLQDGLLDFHHHPLGSSQLPHQRRDKLPPVSRTFLSILSVNLHLSCLGLEIVAILKNSSSHGKEGGSQWLIITLSPAHQLVFLLTPRCRNRPLDNRTDPRLRRPWTEPRIRYHLSCLK